MRRGRVLGWGRKDRDEAEELAIGWMRQASGMRGGRELGREGEI
jgi:hypothetical protein